MIYKNKKYAKSGHSAALRHKRSKGVERQEKVTGLRRLARDDKYECAVISCVPMTHSCRRQAHRAACKSETCDAHVMSVYRCQRSTYPSE